MSGRERHHPKKNTLLSPQSLRDPCRRCTDTEESDPWTIFVNAMARVDRPTALRDAIERMDEAFVMSAYLLLCTFPTG